MFLSQVRVSEEHSEAMLKYMKVTKDIREKKLHKMVFESCGMNDKTFSMILDGILQQCYVDETGKLAEQFLSQLIYSNNEFGSESLQRLKAFIPKMVQLSLNNVTFTESGKIQDRSGSSNADDSKAAFSPRPDICEDLLKCIAYKGEKIMKLKLTNISLKSPNRISYICSIININ